MKSKLFVIIFVLCFVGTFARSYKFLLKEDSSPEDNSQVEDTISSELNRSRRSINSLIVEQPAIKITRPPFLPTRPVRPTGPTMPTTKLNKPIRHPRTVMSRLLNTSSTSIV